LELNDVQLHLPPTVNTQFLISHSLPSPADSSLPPLETRE
jgi:hypothetical protein